MAAVLEKEYKYYMNNKKDILKKYRDKFIVIVGENIVGGYDSRGDALYFASQKYPVGEFFVHRVIDGDEVQKFHSRVYVE